METQRKEQRYYYVTNKELMENDFRATFERIVYNSLIIKLRNNEKHKSNGSISMPKIWISDVLSLDDIASSDNYPLAKGSKSITQFLPKDIMDIIDLYL
jgi:hypothetical protein